MIPQYALADKYKLKGRIAGVSKTESQHRK